MRRNNVAKPRTKVNCSLINERLCCHQHCCLRTRTCQVARDPLTPLALTLDPSLFLFLPFFVPLAILYAQGSDALLERKFSRQAYNRYIYLVKKLITLYYNFIICIVCI